MKHAHRSLALALAALVAPASALAVVPVDEVYGTAEPFARKRSTSC